MEVLSIKGFLLEVCPSYSLLNFFLRAPCNQFGLSFYILVLGYVSIFSRGRGGRSNSWARSQTRYWRFRLCRCSWWCGGECKCSRWDKASEEVSTVSEGSYIYIIIISRSSPPLSRCSARRRYSDDHTKIDVEASI